MGTSLRAYLIDAGWVRVQSVPPLYLLIDSQFPLNAARAKAVGVHFENQYEQVVIEVAGEARSFVEGRG